MTKQLLNSVVTKYHDLSVSRRSIIYLSLRLQQKIDLLATDKSPNFAQPLPIIIMFKNSLKFTDLKRTKLHLGITEGSAPAEHPIKTLTPMRLLAAAAHLNEEIGISLTHKLFGAYWVHNKGKDRCNPNPKTVLP